MPTRSRTPELLVDTSVAVALVVVDHAHHDATLRALAGRHLGLCGHAAFETYSVLTRLPGATRRGPAVVGQLIAANFPATKHLSRDGAASLISELAALGVDGGSVYDALVGATALEHGVVLATRDRRALDTYRALGVELELLPDR